MYAIHVLDPDSVEEVWKPVSVIWETEFGYCYAFDSRQPFEDADLDGATETASGLAANAAILVRVVDLTTGATLVEFDDRHTDGARSHMH